MNWNFDDALITADRHSFFKYMVKTIAEKHGLRATFMPKPFAGPDRQRLPRARLGVGPVRHRQHCSSTPTDELGLSQQGYNFLGGIMHHAEALAAITNPTVNSYKRINAPRTLSGATWSPNTITWTGNNRTHMVRVPAQGPLRAASAGRRRQPVPAAGRRHRRRPRRRRAQVAPRPAPRHRHVPARAHG